MIVRGCLKDTVIEPLLLFVCVLLFLPHWLWSSYLFLFTVSFLPSGYRVSINLSWVEGRPTYVDSDRWYKVSGQLWYECCVLIGAESRSLSIAVNDVDGERCSSRGIIPVRRLDHVVQSLNVGVLELTVQSDRSRPRFDPDADNTQYGMFIFTFY